MLWVFAIILILLFIVSYTFSAFLCFALLFALLSCCSVDADELIISFLGSVKRKDIALRFVCIKNMKNGEN
jgi:hypothetical protein